MKIIVGLLLITPMILSSFLIHKLDKRDLLGTWIYNKIEVGEKSTFERGNFELTRKNYFEMVADIYQELSVEDSLELLWNSEKNYKQSIETYYLFKEDSVFFGNYLTTFVELGIYSFDSEKQEVKCFFPKAKSEYEKHQVFTIKDHKLVRTIPSRMNKGTVVELIKIKGR